MGTDHGTTGGNEPAAPKARRMSAQTTAPASTEMTA